MSHIKTFLRLEGVMQKEVNKLQTSRITENWTWKDIRLKSAAVNNDFLAKSKGPHMPFPKLLALNCPRPNLCTWQHFRRRPKGFFQALLRCYQRWCLLHLEKECHQIHQLLKALPVKGHLALHGDGVGAGFGCGFPFFCSYCKRCAGFAKTVPGTTFLSLSHW